MSSGIVFPKDIHDAMVAAGMMAGQPSVVSVATPAASSVSTPEVSHNETPDEQSDETPEVSHNETQGARLKPASKGFIPPAWFADLRFGCLHPKKRGACMFGPRGTGKTHAIHELARMAGVELVTFQAAAGTILDDLVGYRGLKDGRSDFTDGPLPDALTKDCWFCCEEANMVHPGVWSKTNTLLDGSGDTLRLPDGRKLAAGPNFRLILCFNEGVAYGGAKEVNAALRDRLFPVMATYFPAAQEESMIRTRTGCDTNTATCVVALANAIRAARIPMFDLSPRALFDWLEYVQWSQCSMADGFDKAIIGRVPGDAKVTRDVLTQIAGTVGLGGWNAPVFNGVSHNETKTCPDGCGCGGCTQDDDTDEEGVPL